MNVVLCHHPHSWLIDANQSNDFFRGQAHIVLSGHEHDARCYMEDKSLRVFAGATHPSRREGPWEPCYNVLRVSVDTTAKRELCVQVESRAWRDKDKCFDASGIKNERIPLKAWTLPVASSQLSTSAEPVIEMPSTPDMNATIMTPDAFVSARRKLIVHFFRVGTLSRFQAAITAGVWEEGDDAFDGQERWARVFERAEKNEKLGSLWEAVAAEDQTLTGQINPFTTNP